MHKYIYIYIYESFIHISDHMSVYTHIYIYMYIYNHMYIWIYTYISKGIYIYRKRLNECKYISIYVYIYNIAPTNTNGLVYGNSKKNTGNHGSVLSLFLKKGSCPFRCSFIRLVDNNCWTCGRSIDLVNRVNQPKKITSRQHPVWVHTLHYITLHYITLHYIT